MAMTSTDAEELLRGQLELYHTAMGYIKSKALMCAMDLRVADAILRCGGAATISDLLAATGLPPSNAHYLRRLMRVLSHSRIFALVQRPAAASVSGEAEAAEEAVYALTAASRLLVVDGDDRGSMFPIIQSYVRKDGLSFSAMHTWMKDERAAATSPSEMARGVGVWEFLKDDPDSCSRFSDRMAAETGLTMRAVLAESPAVFQGIASLVDVGGGYGAAAAAIARAFPHVKCTVLDLPQVIAKAAGADAYGAGGNQLSFVAGDMFEHIPPADVVLLKWILHDWNNADCVKILRQCKKAIPHRDAGGKVVIIESVVGSRPHDTICMETQCLFDLSMMVVNGVEREEHEWKEIFMEAGFTDYRITPMHDHRSIIEVYP